MIERKLRLILRLILTCVWFFLNFCATGVGFLFLFALFFYCWGNLNRGLKCLSLSVKCERKETIICNLVENFASFYIFAILRKTIGGQVVLKEIIKTTYRVSAQLSVALLGEAGWESFVISVGVVPWVWNSLYFPAGKWQWIFLKYPFARVLFTSIRVYFVSSHYVGWLMYILS